MVNGIPKFYVDFDQNTSVKELVERFANSDDALVAIGIDKDAFLPEICNTGSIYTKMAELCRRHITELEAMTDADVHNVIKQASDAAQAEAKQVGESARNLFAKTTSWIAPTPETEEVKMALSKFLSLCIESVRPEEAAATAAADESAPIPDYVCWKAQQREILQGFLKRYENEIAREKKVVEDRAFVKRLRAAVSEITDETSNR